MSESPQVEERPSLEQLVNAGLADSNNSEVAEATENQPTPELENAGEHQDGAESGTEAAPAEPLTPSAVEFVKSLNFEIGDMSEEQVREIVRQRLAYVPQEDSSQPQLEAEATEEESTAEPEVAPTPKPVPPVPAAATPQGLEPLEFDSQLEAWLEVDSDGRAKAREGTGEQGILAASKYNSYLDNVRNRVQQFSRDPEGFLRTTIEKIANERFEERMSEFQAKQKEETKKLTRKQREEAEQQAQNTFMEDHKAELFKVAQDGTPILDLNGNPILSELGATIYEEFQDLDAVAAKSEPRSALLKRAYAKAKRHYQPPQQNEVAEPAETSAEKKKKFLADNTNTPAAEPNPSVAQPPTPDPTASHYKSRGELMRQLVASAPENQTNPTVLKMKQ